MHKKDGKVYASLTEVKNKTGDIFAIVDEFGEIFLTSYNKIRYKISKEDVHGVFNIEEKKEKPAKEKKVKPVAVKAQKIEKTKPAAVNSSVFESPAKKEKPEVVAVEEVKGTMFSKVVNVIPWDRNNIFEKNFTEQSMKPLITN